MIATIIIYLRLTVVNFRDILEEQLPKYYMHGDVCLFKSELY